MADEKLTRVAIVDAVRATSFHVGRGLLLRAGTALASCVFFSTCFPSPAGEMQAEEV
jgi:hypothetical protein